MVKLSRPKSGKSSRVGRTVAARAADAAPQRRKPVTFSKPPKSAAQSGGRIIEIFSSYNASPLEEHSKKKWFVKATEVVPPHFSISRAHLDRGTLKFYQAPRQIFDGGSTNTKSISTPAGTYRLVWHVESDGRVELLSVDVPLDQFK